MSLSPSHAASPVVAIVGATGAVGVELINCLERRQFPLAELRLFASARSAGKTLRFRGEKLPVRELTEQSFSGVDIGLFSAGSSTSKRFAPLAVRAGSVVVDNSSASRMDSEVPLVVPEINPEALHGHHGIIANPNCAAIISITPLWPIHRRNRIRRRVRRGSRRDGGAAGIDPRAPGGAGIRSPPPSTEGDTLRMLAQAGALVTRPLEPRPPRVRTVRRRPNAARIAASVSRRGLPRFERVR